MTTSTQTTNSSQNSNTNNYATWQAPYLQQAFGAASNALDKTQNAPTPTGFTAQFTPAMMQAFQNELGFGSNAASSAIPNAAAGAATSLAPAGANASTAGLYGLSKFQPTGGTNYNIDAANRYASGANVPGMVAGAMRDANQEFTDLQAPAIMRNAAASGNVNSTAPDIQQGILQRGLAQKAGDLSASLQSQLYENGLNTAASTANNMNSANLAQMLGLVSGGNQTTGTGVGAGTGAVGQTSGLFDIANTGAANINTGNQANLTNQNQAWQFGTQAPYAGLNEFYNIVGSRPWGSTSQGSGTSTTQSTPSTLQDLMGGMGMLGSAFTGFGNLGGMSGLGNLFSLGGTPLPNGIGKIGMN